MPLMGVVSRLVSVRPGACALPPTGELPVASIPWMMHAYNQCQVAGD